MKYFKILFLIALSPAIYSQSTNNLYLDDYFYPGMSESNLNIGLSKAISSGILDPYFNFFDENGNEYRFFVEIENGKVDKIYAHGICSEVNCLNFKDKNEILSVLFRTPENKKVITERHPFEQHFIWVEI